MVVACRQKAAKKGPFFLLFLLQWLRLHWPRGPLSGAADMSLCLGPKQPVRYKTKLRTGRSDAHTHLHAHMTVGQGQELRERKRDKKNCTRAHASSSTPVACPMSPAWNEVGPEADTLFRPSGKPRRPRNPTEPHTHRIKPFPNKINYTTSPRTSPPTPQKKV